MRTDLSKRFKPWIAIVAAVVLEAILLSSLGPAAWATPAQKNAHQQTAPTLPPPTTPGEPEPPPPPGGSGDGGGGAAPLPGGFGGPGGGAPALTPAAEPARARPELTLTLAGDRELAVPGDRIVLVASVANVGSKVVMDAEVVVSFPGVLALGEATATQGTIDSSNDLSRYYKTNDVVVDIGPMAPGQKSVITVEAVVANETGEDTALEVEARLLSLDGNVARSATVLIGLPPNELPPTARLGWLPPTL